MKKFIKIVFFVLVSCALSLVTYAQQEEVANSKATTENPGTTKVKITTDMGEMVVLLFDATPKHRDNFIKLVQQGFYDSLLFHRIIQGFMIQGGDPLSKNAAAGAMLGMGGGEMQRIPAEFNRNLIHKKGALAAARDGNPEKASSACQFYIVQGSPISADQLKMMGQQRGFDYTSAQEEVYEKLGGTPFLDMEYTVFGELVSGFDVLDKIAAVEKNQNDRPNNDIHMKMELVK
jgi:peptidyl-prolyl cis-trans isomerase B (cyclophilin B)